MVAAVHPYRSHDGGRWSCYLLLSLCVNGIIISHVTLNSVEVPVFEVPVLQVNLMTLAKPILVPKPEQPPEQLKTVTPPAAPVILKPVVTKKQAVEKIVLEVAVPMPREKPKLVLPIKKQVVVEALPVELEKLPETPAVQKVQKVAEIEEKPKPKTEIDKRPSKNEVAQSESSGATGQNESTVISEAKYRHQTSPVYPSRALDMGHQGTVTLHAEVLPSGRPGELKVFQSSGHRLLDRAALSAVKKWRFEPTNIDGKAIVSWVRVPVNFVIQ